MPADLIRFRRGLKNPRAKLTREQVLLIRRLGNHCGPTEISRLTGVNYQTVWLILKGAAYGDVWPSC